MFVPIFVERDVNLLEERTLGLHRKGENDGREITRVKESGWRQLGGKKI